MKVLDVTEFYSERGGGVRSHLTLKSHVLCQLGHEHVVVAPGPRDTTHDSTQDGGLARLIRVGGPSLPYDPTYHLLWRIDKIHAIVRREQPDVLEIQSPYVAAASALTLTRRHFGVRTFLWHADFIDTYLRVMLEDRVGRNRGVDAALEPLWAMVRGIGRGCDAVLVAAKWQVDKLASHGVSRLIHHPFGVEREDFDPSARSREIRDELLGGASPSARVLVGVGRFAVEKRWDVVIDAFIELRQTEDAVLVLFGDGPERAALERRAKGRSDVHFPGFVRGRKELAGALASADALVHGCPFETFGLGVAEAMSAGLPVVVPDRGGAAELSDDSCGERYESANVDACVAAMKRILARDRDTLREAAVKTASKLPGVTEQFARQIEIYEELIAKRTHHSPRATA